MTKDASGQDRRIIEAIDAFAERIGVGKNEIFEITRDKDWVFIVKAAFLLECAVKKTVAAKIDEKALDSISKIEVSKLADLARSLDVFDKDNVNFVSYVCRLRNELIHNVGSYDFSFEKHLLNQKNRNDLLKYASRYVVDPIQIGTVSVPGRQFASENPKWAIVFGIMDIFAIGWAVQDVEELNKVMRDLKDKMADRYIALSASIRAKFEEK